MKQSKIKKIKETLKKTRERRKHQTPCVYQLKLQDLSTKDKELLDRLFIEAKWLYNYIIADIFTRLNNQSWKFQHVEIKTPNGLEKRIIKNLSSQMRRGIVERIFQNLKALKEAKNKGYKVGKLNFVSEVNSIPLPQYNNTYKIFREQNRIKIQKIKKTFRVLGLHQIPENAEIANAHLIRKPSGYYVYVTCFIPKEDNKPKFEIDKSIGVDFGIKNQLTLSNGVKIEWLVSDTKRLKRLHRELSRRKRRGKNYRKTQHKLRREYERISNIRKDIQNRVFSFLKCYNRVIIQDENIKGWYSGWFGKQVHSTGIGGITSRLKHGLETLILVDKFETTTKKCSNCGRLLNLRLGDRVIKCKCGLVIDRDQNAAINIIKSGLKGETTPLTNLPLDWREVTPVERKAAARILGKSPYIRVSCLAEAGSPLLQ